MRDYVEYAATFVNIPALKGAAFSSPATGLVQAIQRRTSGTGYGSPEERDIQRSVIVGITRPAAGSINTAEALAESLTKMETTMTHLRGIGGIDQDEGHALCPTLVTEERLQLVERPIVGSSPLCLAARLRVGALPDPRQILARDRFPAFGRAIHDAPTDSVTRLL